MDWSEIVSAVPRLYQCHKKDMSLLKLNLSNQMLIHFCTRPAPNNETYDTKEKVNKTCSQEVIINKSQVLCHPSQSTLLYK